MKQNQRQKIQVLGIFLVLLLVSGLMAACGDNTASNSTAPSGANTASGTTSGTGNATTAPGGKATSGAGANTTTGAGGNATTAASGGATTAAGSNSTASTGAGAISTDLFAGISKKFSGTTLRIITANHPWQAAMQKFAPQFEQASGMKLSIESYFEDQLSQKLQIGLTSGASGTDVFMFRPLQEGKLFAKNGWLNDLTSYTSNAGDWNWSDFQESPRNTVTFDNKVYGIPIVTEREIVYYRKDLFQQNNMQPPATLDDLAAAAKKFTDPSKGMYGIVMRGQRAAAVTQFSSFLYSEGGTWINNGKSAIGSPEAQSAYKIYGDLLRNYGPQGTLNMSWPQAVAIFQQGKAAMWIDADSLYSNVLDPSKSTVADKVGYAQFPAGKAGSKPYNITSWALGMNAASSNKDAAFEFIKWATSAPVVMNLQQQGNPGARASVWGSPEGLKGFPEEYAKVAQSSAKVGVGFDRPLVINVGDARDIVGDPIVASISGQDLKASITNADTKFNSFLASDK